MGLKIKYTKVEFYFLGLVIYYTLMSLTNLTRLFFNLNIIRLVLLFLLFINIIFIVIHFKYAFYLNHFSILFFFTVLIASLYGLLNNGISFRTLTDILKPINFLLIYTIFTKIELPDDKLIINISKQLFHITIFFGFLTVVIYILVGGRTGVILPFGLPLSLAIFNIDIFKIILILFATFFSGNRASFLVASGVVLCLLIINNKKTFLYILIIGSILFISLKNVILQSSLYKRNIEYTLNEGWDALKNKDYVRLDDISSGRISEIVTIFSNFKAADYIFGKGVGYNYQAKKIINNDFELMPMSKDKSNSHFSPLSLYLSYGLFYVLIFYMFIFYYLRIGYDVKKNSFIIFMSYYLILFTFLESLFSFQIFNNPFLPIACGWIENFRRKL